MENKNVVKPKRKPVKKQKICETNQKQAQTKKVEDGWNSKFNYCLQTMKIETVAHKNLVLMYIKRQNGNQGYTRPIHSAVTKKEKNWKIKRW